MAHPTTEQLRDALGQALNRDADGQPNATLLAWLDGPGHLLGDVDDFARDTDTTEGWVWLLDPDATPREALAWLAQFGGVRLRDGLDEASQRLRVKETAGQKRGTVEAVAGAARQELTGDRVVRIYERTRSDGQPDPYHLWVVTYEADTPDPDAVRDALEEQKPAGLVLFYEVRAGATYAEVAADFATYADLATFFASYADLRTYQPGEAA